VIKKFFARELGEISNLDVARACERAKPVAQVSKPAL
jgi:hypothetical protein